MKACEEYEFVHRANPFVRVMDSVALAEFSLRVLGVLASNLLRKLLKRNEKRGFSYYYTDGSIGEISAKKINPATTRLSLHFSSLASHYINLGETTPCRKLSRLRIVKVC